MISIYKTGYKRYSRTILSLTSQLKRQIDRFYTTKANADRIRSKKKLIEENEQSTSHSEELY